MLDRLATRARRATYAPGQAIFRKGDAGLGLFAVLSGLVRISLPSENGRELVLRLIGPNEVFGEIALLDGGQRTADASAAANCHLLFLDRRDFLAALADEPGFGIKLLAFLCRRLRQTSEQVEDLTFADPSIRLAKALLQLAERQGTIPIVMATTGNPIAGGLAETLPGPARMPVACLAARAPAFDPTQALNLQVQAC